ncbi:MAG: dienelactone hydrolase family protein [Alphaproteobacteria bacterium]|nr:dienelactone hydrolase family protein [Alphaproteobacteria bacterium]
MITPDYVLSSDKETQRLVFLLHGYGANGADLLEIGHFWAPSLPLTTFISPNAPEKCDGGPFGYQWFGIKDLDPLDMRRGLDRAAPALKDFIEGQARTHNLTPNQIALVGFSQGAMLALEMLFYIPGLAGVVAYSGAFYKPPKVSFKGPYPPVLLAHGTLDPVVPYASLALAEVSLKKLGVGVETQSCVGLGHSIDVAGLHRGLEFIQRIFTKNSPIIVMNDKSTLNTKEF